METTDRAALAATVIGAERRTRLIERQADVLALEHGMPLDRARRYAGHQVDEAHAAVVLAVGQVWSRPEGVTLPGAALAGSRIAADSYTVLGFGQPGPSGQVMVQIGEGSWVSIDTFESMWLTAWPETYTLRNEPHPLTVTGVLLEGGAIEEEDAPAEEDGDAGDGFDPRAVWFIAYRTGEAGFGTGEGLPLLSAPYRAVNWKKPEYEPFYGNALDVPAYIAEHLADYRAAWPDYRDRWNGEDSAFDAFNELDGGCECDVRVAAYIGWWLWQRVRSDVVAEYGGTVADFEVHHMWGPAKADAVLAAAPYADPEWEIPADHPLAQCDGQTALGGLHGE